MPFNLNVHNKNPYFPQTRYGFYFFMLSTTFVLYYELLRVIGILSI